MTRPLDSNFFNTVIANTDTDFISESAFATQHHMALPSSSIQQSRRSRRALSAKVIGRDSVNEPLVASPASV
jgi:hypothetical protein